MGDECNKISLSYNVSEIRVLCIHSCKSRRISTRQGADLPVRKKVVSDTLTNEQAVQCPRCQQTYRLGYSDNEWHGVAA
jgi:hypothetical protein